MSIRYDTYNDDYDLYEYGDPCDLDHILSATRRAIQTLEEIVKVGGDSYEAELAKATLQETGYYQEPRQMSVTL